ncbi:hypothetical protein JO861_18935 [Rhodococcus hoagii]|uniref:hypothetical protein n=1 Tax=Rhodococcus hoagii TaxID=43767 RepID=UPI001965AA67|nr:hypothetical protein [Prescottella equi]MBM9838626.1 hypothetical protein [Prescottella equi]
MRTKTLWMAVGSIVAALVLIGGIFLVRQVTTDTVAGTSSGEDSHAQIDPLAPQGAEPQDVARNAMAMLFSWKPAEDSSSWDAMNRAKAAGLLTGQLAQAAATAPTPAPQPPKEWAAWARSGDTVTAAATILDGTKVSGDTAIAPIQIKQIVLHPGGQSTPYKTQIADVTLERGSDGTWRASTYKIRSAR